MKKPLALLLAIAIIFALSGCEKDISENTGNISSVSQVSSSSQSDAASTDAQSTAVDLNSENTVTSAPVQENSASAASSKTGTGSLSKVSKPSVEIGKNPDTTPSATSSEVSVSKPATSTVTSSATNTAGVAAITKQVLKKVEEGFLKLVNEERVRVGVAPLTINNYLDEWAEIRGREIVNTFSHTRPDGSSCFTVIDAQKYKYSTVGENICYTTHMGESSFTSADAFVGSDAQIEQLYTAIFSIFRDSPGHYQNIINPDFEHCGIGISYKDSGSYNIPYFYVAHIFGAER